MTVTIMNILVFIFLFVAGSFARKGVGPGEQDWGYVTVRPEAHMFWWLYETTANVDNITQRPLVIWLQGGPGASSTGLGNFQEVGPLDVDLNPRNHTWVKEVNLLFIDNPVGAGYSYVDNSSKLTTTNKEIVEDLITCLVEFYGTHPEFRHVPLYIASQSYGAKMTVELAFELLRKTTLNLKGVSLIAPGVSPLGGVLNWAPYLYNFGAIDKEGYDTINKSAQKVKLMFDSGQFQLATEEWRRTIRLAKDVAKNIDIYNIIKKVPTSIWNKGNDDKLTNLMNGPVKEKLNLNVTWGAQKDMVSAALTEDFMKPVTNIIEKLLNQTTIKIQVITGQLDLLANTPAIMLWVNKLRWPNVEQWKKAPREVLSVNGINEGYHKSAGKFHVFWINRAGHMIPVDNPVTMETILKMLIK